MMTTGEGANGRSVVCAAPRALLGQDNVSAVGLELFGDKFHLAETLGKLANVVPGVGERPADGVEESLEVLGLGQEFAVDRGRRLCLTPAGTSGHHARIAQTQSIFVNTAFGRGWRRQATSEPSGVCPDRDVQHAVRLTP